MIYLTKRFTFSASHRLFDPKLSDEENYKIFGKCSNPNWHGHNYVLEVTVKGKPDPNTGFVINLTTLKEIVNREVIEKVDHKNLNLEVDFMKGINPTTENLAIAIWNVLADKFSNATLHRIKIYETENNSVEYFGESL